jgi:hypothetical protein
MKLSALAYLLLLLLGSAWMDDTLVASTPGAQDDILAQENNQYPPAPTRAPQARRQPAYLPPTAERVPRAADRAGRGRPAVELGAAWPAVCRPRIYVLMCLRR